MGCETASAAALSRALLSDLFVAIVASAIACSMAFEAASRLFSSPVFKICISSAATDANAQAARFYGLFLWPDADAEGTKATLNPFAFWACFGQV